MIIGPHFSRGHYKCLSTFISEVFFTLTVSRWDESVSFTPTKSEGNWGTLQIEGRLLKPRTVLFSAFLPNAAVLLSYKAMLGLIHISKYHLITSSFSCPFVDSLYSFLLPRLWGPLFQRTSIPHLSKPRPSPPQSGAESPRQVFCNFFSLQNCDLI